ncbi:MAG: CysS/YqeB C-terminal domain-containing protein [Chloroflexota bacterium]
MMEELTGGFRAGRVVLLGSGETSPSGRKAFEQVLQRFQQSPRVALLETPAGFELNSDMVIGRVADFLRHHLQNYRPLIETVAARKRGTPFSPDEEEIIAPLWRADVIFMGPGSPTYAVRQLKNSLAWDILLARHYLGADIVLASAATIAISRFALPVYEIYKVGEELHWKDGLDFFGLYDLPLVFIPHWNNTEGGADLDTSRCFMGMARFASLVKLLPPGITIFGIDERTALILDLATMTAKVVGQGSVTLIHCGEPHDDNEADTHEHKALMDIARETGSHIHLFKQGETFPLSICCPFRIPRPGTGVRHTVWERALTFAEKKEQDEPIPPQVMEMVMAREAARRARDWNTADQIRKSLEASGWLVQDTPEGPHVKRCQ